MANPVVSEHRSPFTTATINLARALRGRRIRRYLQCKSMRANPSALFFFYYKTWWRRDVTHLSSGGYHFSEWQTVMLYHRRFFKNLHRNVTVSTLPLIISST